MSVIFAFVKLYDELAHAEAFMDGRLYMNTLSAFKEYEDTADELRGDYAEGCVASFEPGQFELVLNEHVFSSQDFSGPLTIHDNGLLSENVFCLYSLNNKGHNTVSEESLEAFRSDLILDKSCFGLGKHCVVVLNPTEFLLRCKTAIEKQHFEAQMGLVQYSDENNYRDTLSSKLRGFRKRKKYEKQREYRIKVNTLQDSPAPYFLEVGDLRDITLLTTPEEFNQNLEIRLPE